MVFSRSSKQDFFDKAPKKYDSYKPTLPKHFYEIAERALHENEAIRSQSLAQMREWIAKDPNIVKCRTDALFLLRFLRPKKFNVPAACILYQKYLINRQIYADWFKGLDIQDPHLLQLFKEGFFIPLPERDHRGRQIVIYRFENLDASKYSSTDVFRLQEICFQTMYDDEETQIAGFVLVFDYSGITMKHVAMFSLTDYREYAKVVRQSCPVRMTSLLVLNMPAFLRAFYEITVSFMQKKVQDRFQMFKSLEDFKKEVDVDDYPTEYGGKLKLESILKTFQKKMLKKRDQILALDEMAIEISEDMDKDWFKLNGKSNIQAGGVIGSFRKLEVD
ncbi:clavesin-1-like [Culicoides brevitarsis]|uniref:clavesin-1-like n=1 Tax=Culicoides brevitarsis TaxID=469753 RepID=UPI00307C216A